MTDSGAGEAGPDAGLSRRGPLPRVPDGFDGHPVVLAAWAALTAFGADLDRVSAVILLSMWARRHELSEIEFRAVMRRFPLPADTPAHSWLRQVDQDHA